MASNSCTELEGGVVSLFVLINTTLLVYKQLLRHNNSCSPVTRVQCFEA